MEENSTYPTSIKCYEKLKIIGKGSYSTVFILFKEFRFGKPKL